MIYYFYVSTITGHLKRGPGKISRKPSYFTFLLGSSGYILFAVNNLPYGKFYKVSFGGRKEHAHSLLGIRSETTETSRALKRKKKILT